LSVVRQYLRALAGHDARGVCHTFSPALIAFNARWERAVGGGCARRLQYEHFSTYSPGHGVRRIRIVHAGRLTTEPSGTVGVHLVLWYRFSCQGEVSPIPGCRPHFERIRDVIYLRLESGRWLIVKPGLVYQNTSLSDPPWFDALWPPGDSATVNRPAAIGAPPLTCPTGGSEAKNRHHVLYPTMGAHARPVAAAKAPWLYIAEARFGWLSGDQLCVTITLAGPPQADSSYGIGITQQQGLGELVDDYRVDINGTSGVSARLHDTRDLYRAGRGPCPTAFGLTGDELTLIVSPADHAFRQHMPIRADVGTASLQAGEPLLHHPLDATDTVFPNSGLRLRPPDASRQPRCVPLTPANPPGRESAP
jgi:hypothetical protein